MDLTHPIKWRLALLNLQKEHSINTHEGNASPCRQLDELSPLWTRPLQLGATAVATFESELVLR